MKKKIAIIFLFKEIYSTNYATIIKKNNNDISKLSDQTLIYGNLNKNLKPITKNLQLINITTNTFSKTKKNI